jgi:hypothetical protein
MPRKRYCIACGNDSSSHFITFPSADDERRTWARALAIDIAKVSTKSLVCIEHFDESQYTIKQRLMAEGQIVLVIVPKTGELPSLVLPPVAQVRAHRTGPVPSERA